MSKQLSKNDKSFFTFNIILVIVFSFLLAVGVVLWIGQSDSVEEEYELQEYDYEPEVIPPTIVDRGFQDNSTNPFSNLIENMTSWVYIMVITIFIISIIRPIFFRRFRF